jgi:hypothetical protein
MRSSYSIHNQIYLFRRPEVHLSVCLCPPNLREFSTRSVTNQRKEGNYFFPDHLVIRQYMLVF